MRHMIEAKKAQNTNSRKLIVRGAGMNLVFVVAEVGPANGDCLMIISPRYDQYKDAWDTEVEFEVFLEEKYGTTFASVSSDGIFLPSSAVSNVKLKRVQTYLLSYLLNAAVEDGIVVGGGCTLLRLAAKVDIIKETLGNDKPEVGSDIVKRALSYPMKLIAKNVGQISLENRHP
ncbi:RuBisCO large subunit-binding protein subunit beta, chloroplastic-like protein [Tanacetum coccineum]